MRNYFKSGSWNITCDRCSKKTKADEIKKEWTGFLVCPVCFEHRHPQDFVRARQDKISVPFTRPRPVDSFRLLHTMQDMVQVSDDDHFDDYMFYDVSNMYFLEDYILDQLAFTIQVKWNRPILDPVSVTEYCALSYKKPFTDSVTITENVMIGSIYRSTFTDTLTLADSGDIFQSTYVDGTYFSEQYVGTIYTF